MLTTASISDLWFAYALFQYEDTGERLIDVAGTFLGLLVNIGANVPEYVTTGWLVKEYRNRL